MQIARGITNADWKKLDFNDPSDWERAISIFDKRIRDRFANAIDFLIADDEAVDDPNNRRWGFAILALDCLLIETLQAFRQGLTDTSGKSGALFVSFLTSRPAFKSFFSTADLATRFYKEFRCGLHHNAQVFRDGLVWSVGPLLRLDGQRMVLNRTALHSAVMTELDEYASELRTGTDPTLRQNFIAKMNFIAAA